MEEDSNTILLLDTKPERTGFGTAKIKKQILRLFPKIIHIPYGNKRMTAILIRGTLLVALFLTLLLIINGILVGDIKLYRLIILGSAIVYLVISELLIQKNKFVTGAWMLIALYGLIAMIVLLHTGLNTPLGIMVISFTVLLAGTLLETKNIFAVTSGAIIVLCCVQIIHSLHIITPTSNLSTEKSYFVDVVTYATIISIFGLISWLSGKQTEHSIRRAVRAENKIKLEKTNLVQKLEEQSTAMRQLQLQEMANLYKFAEIGQSTTAILHELSNRLSVLSLDIHDLELRHRQSKAIQHTKEGIENINLLVHETRKRLRENRDIIRFNAIPIIERVIKELQPKFTAKSVKLQKVIPKRTSFQLKGDPSNLSHVITILLNNAYDACVHQQNSSVKIAVIQTAQELTIEIDDNGEGILPSNIHKLFQPQQSSKPNGLGIGLYIAKNIITTQFNGKIFATPLAQGVKFTAIIPRYQKQDPQA